MLVYRYIHIHRWINTILSPNIFFPSLLAQKSFLQRKWALQLRLEMFPAMYNAISPHEQWEKTCAHMKKWQSTTYVENYFMQKILLCRKIPFMQKNFFYAENSSMQKITLCRKFFYAENSSMQKIIFMQKILLCRKLFYAENFFYAEKFLLGINPFTKQCPWLTCFSFACDIGTYNWMTFCTSSNNTYNWRNHN